MTPISPQNALKFSMWLASAHPDAFHEVVRRLVPATSLRQRSALGGLGTAPHTGPRSPLRGARPMPGARPHKPKQPHFVRGQFGGAAPGTMGSFGEDLPEITVSADAPLLEEFTPTVQMMPTWDMPSLEQINVDVPPTLDFNLAGAANSADNAGGFWSSLGSGLSSIGGGLVSAVGTVARAVTNPAVLTGAAQIAATVIKANANNTQAQQQLQLLQTQQQRTLTGAGAQPLQYGINPATGQQVPYYYNPSTGQYQMTQPGFFSSLSSGSGLSSYLPYVLIGGGVILVVALMKGKSA